MLFTCIPLIVMFAMLQRDLSGRAKNFLGLLVTTKPNTNQYHN